MFVCSESEVILFLALISGVAQGSGLLDQFRTGKMWCRCWSFVPANGRAVGRIKSRSGNGHVGCKGCTCEETSVIGNTRNCSLRWITQDGPLEGAQCRGSRAHPRDHWRIVEPLFRERGWGKHGQRADFRTRNPGAMRCKPFFSTLARASG